MSPDIANVSRGESDSWVRITEIDDDRFIDRPSTDKLIDRWMIELWMNEKMKVKVKVALSDPIGGYVDK